MKSSKLCKPAPFLLVALCVAIGGCGSSAVRQDSDQLMKEGQYEAGIARLEEALRDDPRDTELNIALAHSRQAAVEALITQPTATASAMTSPMPAWAMAGCSPWSRTTAAPRMAFASWS